MRFKKTKYVVGVIFLIMVFSLLISSEGKFDGYMLFFNQQNIYSDDEKIKADSNSYSYLTKEGKVVDHEADIKFNFSGVDTLWHLETEEAQEIELKYDSQIQEGDFKVVLITPEKEVIKILEGTKNEETKVKLDVGISKIKIVGKKAKGNMTFSIIHDGTIKLTPRSYVAK